MGRKKNDSPTVTAAKPKSPVLATVDDAILSKEIAVREDAESRSKRAFFGRSGHLAVMAELLHRRVNVAIPEVDVGDDIFVVKGADAVVTRVQVKGSTATEQLGNYCAQFNVPEDQLSVPQDNPPLVYIFPIRRGTGKRGRWSDFFVIRRGTLYAKYINQQAGTRIVDTKTGKANVRFRVVLTDTTALSGTGQVDLQPYREAWEPWPPPALEAEENAQAQMPEETDGFNPR